jgi:hypothetical protein
LLDREHLETGRLVLAALGRAGGRVLGELPARPLLGAQAEVEDRDDDLTVAIHRST